MVDWRCLAILIIIVVIIVCHIPAVASRRDKSLCVFQLDSIWEIKLLHIRFGARTRNNCRYVQLCPPTRIFRNRPIAIVARFVKHHLGQIFIFYIDKQERTDEMSIKTVDLSLNGQSYNIPLISTGKYQKKIAAPNKTSWNEEDHKYAMRLTVEDVAGNVTTIDKSHETFGEKMMLRVTEDTPPVIVITSPAESAYLGSNSVKVEANITDTESGVDPDSITIQIDSGAVISAGITKTPIENGYKCSYTATVQDGQHTVKVNAADNDGNEAIEKTASFTVDTVAPELNVTYPPETLITNKQAITVTGKTDTDCTVKIKVNSQDQGTISINGTGEFSKSVNLQKGSNVIVITSTDKAGKVSTVQREVQYDPDAPVVVSIEFNPNPVGAGEEFTITVEATDD